MPLDVGEEKEDIVTWNLRMVLMVLTYKFPYERKL